MDLAEEVDVGSPLPLPRPLVLLEHATEEHLRLVPLFDYLQLEYEGEREIGEECRHTLLVCVKSVFS